MWAWRRANVEALNELGRHRWDQLGLLSGPELQAPGGRLYRSGDRIVTLAPAADGQVVTSSRGTVTAVDASVGSLQVRFDGARSVRLTGDDLGRDRLAHGYAMTVHRSQGATVDSSHSLEDGGGRELAYVKMSRARQHSHVYVTADNIGQAVDDLTGEWARQRRQRWAIDTGTPITNPQQAEHDPAVPTPLRTALHRERLATELNAVAAAGPPDRGLQLARARSDLKTLRASLAGLDDGHVSWNDPALAAAAQPMIQARHHLEEATRGAANPRNTRRQRNRWTRQASLSQADLDLASQQWHQASGPYRARLERASESTEDQVSRLEIHQQRRQAWHQHHPEVGRRLEHLTATIRHLDLGTRLHQDHRIEQPGRDLGIGL